MSGGITRSIAFAVLLLGCGATSTTTDRLDDMVIVEPYTFLRGLGADASAVMREPEAEPDAIDAQRREARGSERLSRTVELVGAYVHAWEAAEERRDRRRLRRLADRFADAGIRAARRDRGTEAQLDFAKLWMSYVAAERGAGRRAERFTRRYAQTGGGLVGIAWMIRGEVALENEEHDEAIDAFRFALGQPGTALYAYALYRTGIAHQAEGEDAEAEQAMSEAMQMGCDSEDARIVEVAGAAASSNHTPLRRDPDGVLRPSTCPSHEELAEEEPEGWRPAE